MSEPLQIKVDRVRSSSCPYCKGEVTGGHVWLCPGCAAPHHTDCLSEHGACATCGHKATAAVKPAADATFTRHRAAIASLGFAILREDERELLALHPAWQGQSHLVHLVASETLTRDQVEADTARLARDPLAQGNASSFQVTRRIEPAALEWLRAPSSARTRGTFACVPMASTPEGLLTPQGWLGDSFPLHADVARHILSAVAQLTPAPQPPAPPPPPSAPVVVYATPRPPTGLFSPLPEATTPPAPGEESSAKDILVAIALAIAVGILLLSVITQLSR